MQNTNAPVLTPTEARQASPRRMNFHVLVWSMVLAVVVAAILYYAIYAPQSPIALPKEQPATSAPAPDAVPAPQNTPVPPSNQTNP
jgi:multidrug efflux pump subunit AcrA (membrane-fusion protein)